jgi:hypothetical protein
MKMVSRKSFFIGMAIMLLAASCATTRSLHVWKDEAQTQKLGKTMIFAVADLDTMRTHTENMLAWRLRDKGIDATASNKLMPKLGSKPDRAAITAKVRELGYANVVVIRPVSKVEYSQLVPSGVYLVSTTYSEGYGTFYAESFTLAEYPGSAYDVEFFTMSTNIYDVSSEKLIWSYLSKTKVEGSREKEVNPFIETIIKKLGDSNLL